MIHIFVVVVHISLMRKIYFLGIWQEDEKRFAISDLGYSVSFCNPLLKKKFEGSRSPPFLSETGVLSNFGHNLAHFRTSTYKFIPCSNPLTPLTQNPEYSTELFWGKQLLLLHNVYVSCSICSLRSINSLFIWVCKNVWEPIKPFRPFFFFFLLNLQFKILSHIIKMDFNIF